MKKLLLIIAILCTSATFSQAVFDEGIQVTNTESLTAPYVNVQETDGTINRIDKSTFESVQTAANYAALPASGSLTVLYITIDTGRLYRWDGSSYIGVASNATLLNGEGKAAIISGLASESDINAGGLLEYNNVEKTVWNNGKGGVESNMSFGESALRSNTTGTFNTAYGSRALRSNTIGTDNFALGSNALFSNIAGGNNIAIGRNAILANTSGHLNVAIGNFAINSSVSGSDNIAIGINAGRLFSNGGGGDLVNVDEAIFIGNGTKAKADNSVNEIVVGYNAIGNGSNTATLGNTSISSTYLQGVINGNGANITNVNAATLEGFTAAQLTSPDATTSVKGVIKLAGDLGGTADLPTVNGLSALIGEKGFGYYVDGLSTPTITIGTTWTQITIDALGANVTTSLPLDIRGTSQLWSNNEITPIAGGDDYDGRLDLTIDSTSGPAILEIIIDYGNSTPGTSIAFSGEIITLVRIPPFQYSMVLDFFAGDTFKANGGKIYARTDGGTCTISRRNIKITRKSKKFN